MEIKQIGKYSIQFIQIDKKLNKYKNQILFPELLKKANEILKKTGIPKI